MDILMDYFCLSYSPIQIKKSGPNSTNEKMCSILAEPPNYAAPGMDDGKGDVQKQSGEFAVVFSLRYSHLHPSMCTIIPHIPGNQNN